MIKSVLKLTKLSQFLNHVNADSVVRLPCPIVTNWRNVHLTSKDLKEIRGMNDKISKIPNKKDVILEGEDTAFMGNVQISNDLFPNKDTPNRLFDGILYSDLHIVNIKSTSNNTIMTVTTAAGVPLVIRSAGIEGFKNAKKGTNIAAQQAAIIFGQQVLRNSIYNVRVRVQGIGPGRMSSLKGLQMAGLNVVSITDDTRVSWCPRRPKKPRKL
ncbi:hypothetical protein KM043_004410 [Ampulex compressa]|nr:hypothetical protein KM043_004410 [Ampulex compressa]